MISARTQIRHRSGLTLRQLARRAKVSATRLSEHERGEVQLRDDELMRVSIALASELSEPIPSTAGDIFRSIERFRIVEPRSATASH